MLRALTVVIHSFVPSFQLGSERIKVGQVRFDTKRCATRFNFGFLKSRLFLEWIEKFICSSVQVICPICSWDTCWSSEKISAWLKVVARMDCSLVLSWHGFTNSRPKEATDLLDAGVVKANDITRTVFNQTHGFACCSARQCIQRRVADSDCVSFLATNVSFFGRGLWCSQFWLLEAGFLGTIWLSFLIRSFFLGKQHWLQEGISHAKHK